MAKTRKAAAAGGVMVDPASRAGRLDALVRQVAPKACVHYAKTGSWPVPEDGGRPGPPYVIRTTDDGGRRITLTDDDGGTRVAVGRTVDEALRALEAKLR